MTGISRAVWEQEGEETGPAPEADSSGTAGVLPSVGGASLPLHSEIQDFQEIAERGFCIPDRKNIRSYRRPYWWGGVVNLFLHVTTVLQFETGQCCNLIG